MLYRAVYINEGSPAVMNIVCIIQCALYCVMDNMWIYCVITHVQIEHSRHVCNPDEVIQGIHPGILGAQKVVSIRWNGVKQGDLCSPYTTMLLSATGKGCNGIGCTAIKPIHNSIQVSFRLSYIKAIRMMIHWYDLLISMLVSVWF